MRNSRQEWISRSELSRHFRKHGQKFPYSTEAQYEASSLSTIQLGSPFTFKNRRGVPRIGYYHSGTNRLTMVTDDDRFIVTHFPPTRGADCCRTRLASTYP